jgi:hypothetical protein
MGDSGSMGGRKCARHLNGDVTDFSGRHFDSGPGEPVVFRLL